MWESKAWIVLERIISLITILVLLFAVWSTLLAVKTEQAKQSKQINATLEAIRERMKPESWQQVEPSLQKNKSPE